MTEEIERETLALAHSRWTRRRLRAVERLRTSPAAFAVPVLTDLLHDRWGRVANEAAEALLECFGDAGYAALLDALDDEREWTKLAAARVLAFTQEPRALLALDEALRGPDLDQWGPAVEGMELFGEAARSIFERELADEENGPRMLREMCAGALANVAGEEARPALERAAASRDRFVANAAREALTRLGG